MNRRELFLLLDAIVPGVEQKNFTRVQALFVEPPRTGLSLSTASWGEGFTP